jgi:hypothetical protein
VPSELKYAARSSRPAGDFRSRLFRCSPPVSRLHRCNALRRLCPRYRRGLCAFIRRAGVIVPPGEPLGGTSPAARLRLPRGGGAGPSPRNHRHDRCSRREELAGLWISGGRRGETEQKKMRMMNGMKGLREWITRSCPRSRLPRPPPGRHPRACPEAPRRLRFGMTTWRGTPARGAIARTKREPPCPALPGAL